MSSRVTDSEGSKNLRAMASSTIGGPLRLFDEIFGPTLQTKAPPTFSTPPPLLSAPRSGGTRDIFAEMPSHVLPPISSLWRGLLRGQLKPISATIPARKGIEGETTGNNSDEEEDEAHTTALHNSQALDAGHSNTAEVEMPTDFVDSPDSLKQIFAESIAIYAEGAAGKTPDTAVPTSRAKAEEKKRKHASGTNGKIVS